MTTMKIALKIKRYNVIQSDVSILEEPDTALLHSGAQIYPHKYIKYLGTKDSDTCVGCGSRVSCVSCHHIDPLLYNIH